MQNFEDIFEVVKLVPYGRVTSYGAIARYLGTGARLVGWAMNASHQNPEVPAHRVVNSQGLLTGKLHFITDKAMQERLEAEGTIVKNDKVIDFKNKLWDPSIALSL